MTLKVEISLGGWVKDIMLGGSALDNSNSSTKSYGLEFQAMWEPNDNRFTVRIYKNGVS